MQVNVIDRLKQAGLRPTRQRIAIGRVMWEYGHRHMTAETLHQECQAQGEKVSLATIYNTLHQFTRAGLLREIAVEGNLSYFDTNTEPHHHFIDGSTGRMMDIPDQEIALSACPAVPEGYRISGIEVMVRLEPLGKA